MADDRDRPQHRPIDPVTLLLGMAALLVSATALTDGTGWLPGFDPRLLVAAGAVVIGLLLMVGALRRPGGRSRRSEHPPT